MKRIMFLTTVTVVILLSSVVTLSSSFVVTNIGKASAQNMARNATNPNMTKGAMMMGGMTSSNITGSLKLSTILGNAFSSAIKVSLSQAITNAEKAAGNNSHAVAAHVGAENGYLVYTLWIVDGSYNFHRVVIDAGNGKALADQKMSEEHSMTMHGMMMSSMMMGTGGPELPGMMTGPQHGSSGMMHGGAPGGHGMMMGGPGMAKQWP